MSAEARVRDIELEIKGMVRRRAFTHSEAEDFHAQAIYKVLLAIQAHPEVGRGFLIATARNAISDARRMNQVRANLHADLEFPGLEALDKMGSMASPDPSPEIARRDSLRWVLCKMQPMFSEALVAYAETGRAIDAAESLNISVQAFKSRLYRARAVAQALLLESA